MCVRPNTFAIEAALDELGRQIRYEQVLGCLLGSAIGDAVHHLDTDILNLFSPVGKAFFTERFSRRRRRRRRRLNPGAPHHQQGLVRPGPAVGEWTSNTDQAMLILLAYLDEDGKTLDPNELAHRLQTLSQQGLRALDTMPPDLGGSVRDLLEMDSFLDGPEAAAQDYWTSTGYTAATNGSLVRIHPLGLICRDKTEDETFETAASFSCITHVDSRCIVSCAIGAGLIRKISQSGLHNDADIDALVDRAIAWWKTYRERCIEKDELRQKEPHLDVKELKRHTKATRLKDLELGRGQTDYVYKCLGAGIYLLRVAVRAYDQRWRGEDVPFQQLLAKLSMQGGDVNANACFAGALIGTCARWDDLPAALLDRLNHRDWLLDKSEELCAVFGKIPEKRRPIENKKKDTGRDGGRGTLSSSDMEKRAIVLQDRIDEKARRESEMSEGKVNRWFCFS